MRSVDWALVTSFGSLAISLVGTGVAGWQARLAKASAEASKRAADASGAQALAAVEQANLLRRQLRGEVADRDQRNAPSFDIRIVGDAEWGTWNETRGNGREFVSVSKDNTASVQNWVRRRVLVLGHQSGPAVTTSIALLDGNSAQARLLSTGPFEMVEGAIVRVPLITAYDREGTEVTVVISTMEQSGGRRAWHTEKSISL